MIALQYRTMFERIRCGVSRRLGHNVDDLLGSGAMIEEICSEETIVGQPCIALPDQFERVRAGAFKVDLIKEIAEVQGAPRTIGSTVSYVLDDVLITPEAIYRKGKRKLFNYEIQLDKTEMSWAEYGEVALRSSFVGCHFFGHWLRDDCATHLLAERAGAPASMPTPPWPDREGYLALFGQRYTHLNYAHVKKLVLFDDISQNSHKAERFRQLRARVRISQVTTAPNRIVYLMRGSGGKQRTLSNETEVAEALERRGATIVRAEALEVPQLVAELLDARIIISVEGSQLSHGLYALREGGGVLVIQPPHRFFNSHMDWARALNMRYGIVVGQKCEDGFSLPVDDLLRTIDLMDAEVQ